MVETWGILNVFGFLDTYYFLSVFLSLLDIHFLFCVICSRFRLNFGQTLVFFSFILRAHMLPVLIIYIYFPNYFLCYFYHFSGERLILH